MTDFTREALGQLRQTDDFQWATVFLLSLVMYVYANEYERRNWSAIFAGLALWGMDWINEVLNALVLHGTDRAAVWTTTGHTSFQIFVGLNIEISFMFLIAGVVFVKFLPPDPAVRVLGIPNRDLLRACSSRSSRSRSRCCCGPATCSTGSTGGGTSPTSADRAAGYATFYAMAAWVYDMHDAAAAGEGGRDAGRDRRGADPAVRVILEWI